MADVGLAWLTKHGHVNPVICSSKTVKNTFKYPVRDTQEIRHPLLLWQVSQSQTVQTV